MKSSPIAAAKYVVDSHYANGNKFLHGPFVSKAKAAEYLSELQDEDLGMPEIQDKDVPTAWTFNRAARPVHRIRLILHPTKWTKAGGS